MARRESGSRCLTGRSRSRRPPMSVLRWAMGQVLMWSTPTLPWPPADTALCDSEAEQSRDSSAARFHPGRLARPFAPTFRPCFPTSYERGPALVSAILLRPSIFPLVSRNSFIARPVLADRRSFAWLKRRDIRSLMVGSGGRFCARSADGGSARTSHVSLKSLSRRRRFPTLLEYRAKCSALLACFDRRPLSPDGLCLP